MTARTKNPKPQIPNYKALAEYYGPLAMALIERLQYVDELVGHNASKATVLAAIQDSIGPPHANPIDKGDNLELCELKHIMHVVATSKTQQIAAKRLGINRTTLYTKIKRSNYLAAISPSFRKDTE